MDTTTPTGWTLDPAPLPASRAQLEALISILQLAPKSEKRDSAIAAVDNAIDCVREYTAWCAEVDAQMADDRDLHETQDFWRL